ncbi:MAG: putative DNA binding domain-containing protein [Candidatus Marinimicrobia bacterium]|nr:putative DNA binding domain-containing protein [Candidatus Neomarinimicrobiota bacterium]
MTTYPLTALELIPDIDEEAVSDVFVRINSKGTLLNQADFILTLMSVFWDDGRAQLEEFCRDSRIPAKDKPSPYNNFIEPSPDQLLRVSVGVAFKRARLKYVYSILRGKDLETEKFSVECRERQFEELKKAQERVLNLQYWHDFMKCIQQAGFRSHKMISSQNNLIFSYILYLIGRTEYKVTEHDLRRAISRWFFMSALTGRFAKSPESSMEYDLARLRPIKTSSEFIQALNKICDITLTSDYWTMTLPNQLATSSSRSPSLFAYEASLILLDAPVLFSKMKFSTLCDPSIQAKRASIEKHHLFPKEYLKSKGITETIDYNQIANYAFVEWNDNNDISNMSPKEYFPKYKKPYNKRQLDQMYYYHALPEDWENMKYQQFLERRRELIAQVIADGYATLISKKTEEEKKDYDNFDLTEKIMDGESEEIEFKSTLRTNLHTNNKDPRMEYTVLRTIAGFLNTNGGRLIIGVSDDGEPIGLEVDGFPNEDKMTLHLVNIIKSRMGVLVMNDLHIHFDDFKRKQSYGGSL